MGVQKLFLLHMDTTSSEPSPQSLSWSHFHLSGIHLPDAQVKSAKTQHLLIGGSKNTVNLTYLKLLKIT